MPDTTDTTAPAGPTAPGPSAPSRSLGNITLLADVPTPRLQRLAEECQWHTYAPDDIVFDHDDTSTDVYFVVRGKLRIVIFSAGTAPDPDGGGTGSVTMAEMTSGDAFGELSAIDGRPRSARAVALDNCVLARLPSAAMIQLLEDCPKVGVTLLRHFAGMIRSLNRRVHSLSTLTPSQRVYAELARIAEPNPIGDGSWLIAQLPSHGELAEQAGAPREVVAQAIGHLAREDVLERRHKSLLIKNHARLRMLAHM